jgi:hypothetical protein
MASNHLRLVVNNPPVEPSVETSTKKQKVTPVERQHDRIKELAGSLEVVDLDVERCASRPRPI